MQLVLPYDISSIFTNKKIQEFNLYFIQKHLNLSTKVRMGFHSVCASVACEWKLKLMDASTQITPMCRELSRIPNLWEKKNIYRKHTPKKKNNYTHKTIFTWFGNLPTFTELQGFHYFQGRIQYNMQLQYFLYIWNTATDSTLKNLNYKRRFHNGLNRPKNCPWALRLGPKPK